MTTTPVAPTFSLDYVTQLAYQAATLAGLGHSESKVIRLGEHAIVRLAGGVIARVARGMAWGPSGTREVQLARALIAAGVPCVAPFDVEQPIVIEGHPVTLWEEIPGPISQPSMADFGRVLRQLHFVDVAVNTPTLDPWAKTRDRIEDTPVTAGERQILQDVFAEVQDAWPSATFELGSGLLHADAHIGNVAQGSDGSVVLIDLETMCTGPREWDLAPIGLYVTSLGWISRAEYAQFVNTYGYDITTSPAFPLLARMRELRMTTWLAQHVGESEKTAAEVSHRIACLADPDLPRRWSAR